MIVFRVNDTMPTIAGQLYYYQDEYSFSFKPTASNQFSLHVGQHGRTSLLIGSLQVEISIEYRSLLFAWGYHPYQRWREKDLTAPKALAYGVTLGSEIVLEEGISVALVGVGSWDTWYDSETQWVCVGSYHQPVEATIAEFATNTIAVISKSRLVALWLKAEMIHSAVAPNGGRSNRM
jgi:hypothetical protein